MERTDTLAVDTYSCPECDWTITVPQLAETPDDPAINLTLTIEHAPDGHRVIQ